MARGSFSLPWKRPDLRLLVLLLICSIWSECVGSELVPVVEHGCWDLGRFALMLDERSVRGDSGF